MSAGALAVPALVPFCSSFFNSSWTALSSSVFARIAALLSAVCLASHSSQNQAGISSCGGCAALCPGLRPGLCGSAWCCSVVLAALFSLRCSGEVELEALERRLRGLLQDLGDGIAGRCAPEFARAAKIATASAVERLEPEMATAHVLIEHIDPQPASAVVADMISKGHAALALEMLPLGLSARALRAIRHINGFRSSAFTITVDSRSTAAMAALVFTARVTFVSLRFLMLFIATMDITIPRMTTFSNTPLMNMETFSNITLMNMKAFSNITLMKTKPFSNITLMKAFSNTTLMKTNTFSNITHMNMNTVSNIRCA